MQVEYDESVRDQFIQIINHTELETSFRELFAVLRQYLPLDWINISIFNTSRRTLRYLAMITKIQTIPVDETVKLSADGCREAEKVITGKTLRWNDVNKNSLGKDIVTHFDIKEPLSTIGLIKQLGPSRYAVLGLVANKCDRYENRHYDFLKRFYEPMAGVTYHFLTQLEMANLKERLIVENQEMKKRLGYLDSRLIAGTETGLRHVMDQVAQVAPLDSPVLLLGETGVGKEIIAKEIHRQSKRSNGPLVSVNCGAIPETLLDSELFGYEKGAFTGANKLKRGYFEQADGGSVFLDEIGELAMQAQVRLLRLLQTMVFQRVGGNRSLAIDVRIIAATNRDLIELIQKQQFRKDLWFRINVFPIHIPPLRERKEDIQEMAEYFIKKKSKEMNLAYDPVFAPEAILQLRAYDWPGNVRELQNVIERALITSQGRPLSFHNLEAVNCRTKHEMASCEPGRFLTLDEMIAIHIRRSLSLSNGRIGGSGGAAEFLGMHPSTLRARMRKLGIGVKRVIDENRK